VGVNVAPVVHFCASFACIGCCITVRCASNRSGAFVEYEDVAATGLTEQRLTNWLPPGYDRATRRYPVVYMYDAQNLFDPAKSGFNKIWAADKPLLAVMATGKVEPHIIVGIWAPCAARYRQYLPLDV
jgi:enterochelin esterase-like enzyme